MYNGLSTYYVRDAQGNSLAVYDNAGNTSNWREQTLYGSSRLGMWKPNLNLAQANGSSIWNSYGLKFFELSNHLGNVMAVINDVRQTGNGYEPTVINANSYYAFGAQMPGNSFALSGAEAYRYGFNGKENDNEVKGTANQQDYGMRIYDPRIGKFLSVDPITAEYPELTPYQFASNTPIQAIDLDGLEKIYYNLSFGNKGKPKLELTTIENFKLDSWTGKYVGLPLSYTISYNNNDYFFQTSKSGYYNTENTMDDLGKWLYVSSTASNAPAFEDIFYSKKEFWNEVTDQAINEWVDGFVMSKMAAKSNSGVIYEVPGEFTSSGKPYIGRHNSPDPANRSSADGRPRGKAKVIGRYDKSDPNEGSFKEQSNMNLRGGKSKLDNKRDEVNPLRMEALTKKYGNRSNIVLPATKSEKRKKERPFGNYDVDIIKNGP